MPRGKRTFANVTQLPSKRWQVKYTGPDGVRRYAPHTFANRDTAEAWVVATRRKIDKDQWDATDDDPKELITFGVYAQRWLTNRQVAGRPIKARTPVHYSAILDDHLLPTFGHRQLAAIKPKDAAPVAKAIVRGIERDQLVITADFQTAVLARAAGLLGPYVRRSMDRTIRRVRGTVAQPQAPVEPKEDE